MTAPIDFQSEENRWAAQMACDEANAVSGKRYEWVIEEVQPRKSSIYALALRILRTEEKPVDPLVKAFQDAGVVPGGMSIVSACNRIKATLHQHGFEIAALAQIKDQTHG